MTVELTPYLLTKRVRSTLAEINAAGGKFLLPALDQYAYRLIDVVLIAYGAAASGATTVDIIGTRNGVPVRLYTFAMAVLGRGVVARLSAGLAITVLTDGDSFAPLDENSGVVIGTQAFPGAGNLAGCTGIDALLTYILDPAAP